MTTTEVPTINEAKLESFVGQAVVDMGAAISGLLLHAHPLPREFCSRGIRLLRHLRAGVLA